MCRNRIFSTPKFQKLNFSKNIRNKYRTDVSLIFEFSKRLLHTFHYGVSMYKRKNKNSTCLWFRERWETLEWSLVYREQIYIQFVISKKYVWRNELRLMRALCVLRLRWIPKTFKSTRKIRIFCYIIMMEKGTEIKQLIIYDEKFMKLKCFFYLKSLSIGAQLSSDMEGLQYPRAVLKLRLWDRK